MTCWCQNADTQKISLIDTSQRSIHTHTNAFFSCILSAF